MLYTFSVGKLTLKKGSDVIKTIEYAKDISVDYRINTHKEYGPEGQVTSDVVETEELTLTATFVEPSWDTNLNVGDKYDVVLAPSSFGTGMSLTLANCRITGYSMKSAQAEYVTATLTLSKLGKLDDEAGAEVTKQKIKFGNVYLGDSATLDTSYDGNITTHIIPTALGILTRPTGYMGGGQLNINVKGYVEKATRLEVEAYLLGLYTQLSTTSATLTVEYGGSSYTIPNCIFSKAGGSGNGKYSNFNVEFVKSAY